MSKGFDEMFARVKGMLELETSIELEKIFFSEVIPKITENLMRSYDSLLMAHEPGYDPAKPSVAREAFQTSIARSLKETLKVEGTKVAVSAGNEEELGYKNHNLSYLKDGVSKDPNPLEWLIFYLEGFIGDFYFVTEEDFEKFVAAGLRTQKSLERFKSWGWYGQGFLIPANVYRAQKFDTAPGVEHKKHPFSGQRGEDIFEAAMEGIEIVELVERAITKATGTFR